MIKEKNYRLVSIIGLIIFLMSVGLIIYKKEDILYFGLGLVFLFIGWLIFSTFHTKIAINKLKAITDNYVKSKVSLNGYKKKTKNSKFHPH